MAENTNSNTAEIVQNDNENQKEETRSPERYTTPAVDIYEEKEGLVVTADLPGVTHENINIDVDQNILTIKATPETWQAEGKLQYQEFEDPVYYRQFKLGESINRENIAADYRHGVLTLKLPFAEAAKPRRISVNVA